MFRLRSTDRVLRRPAESKGPPAPAWPPALWLFLEKGPPGTHLLVTTALPSRNDTHQPTSLNFPTQRDTYPVLRGDG